MSKEEVIHAYRQLYRAALKAVCYSKPASFVARDQLRRAFRNKSATFDGSAIRRTVWFLHNAANERGMEHQIVRNILLTQFWRSKENTVTWKSLTESNFKKKKECVRCHLGPILELYKSRIVADRVTQGLDLGDSICPL